MKEKKNETIQMSSEVSVCSVKKSFPLESSLFKKSSVECANKSFYFRFLRPFCCYTLSVRICSVLNRSNRDTTGNYRLVFCAFSWPNMVKWRNSGIIKLSFLQSLYVNRYEYSVFVCRHKSIHIKKFMYDVLLLVSWSWLWKVQFIIKHDELRAR